MRDVLLAFFLMIEINLENIAQEGGMTLSTFATVVAAWAVIFHALVGFIMPLFAVGMVVYFFGPRDERSIRPALNACPLCLFAGVTFVVLYWLSAWFLTAEFPSMISSMAGSALAVAVLRAGYPEPDDWEFPPREEWPSHWIGTIESKAAEDDASTDTSPSLLLLEVWAPYLILGSTRCRDRERRRRHLSINRRVHRGPRCGMTVSNITF